MKATFKKYTLIFKKPSATSRGVLKVKDTYFIKLTEADKVGYGECGLLRGLSIEDKPDYEEKLVWLCTHIQEDKNYLLETLISYPSIRFGLEQAFQSLDSKNPFHLLNGAFTRRKKGVPINGLIWMGNVPSMLEQIDTKIAQGFSCIKIKIGAIDFQAELDILTYVRQKFSKNKIELRVDANGAFEPEEALDKLEQLAVYDLHSIEQPIRQGQWEIMANLCKHTPIPIALDEELIGVFDIQEKQKLLQKIAPQYIVIKPSILGGFTASKEWINLAVQNKVGWWITSALESNIGLNAIAQWTASLHPTMPQGLGTGNLYTNNISSPLEIKNGKIQYNKNKNWEFKF